ncbi:MAG: DNA translocase FtsK [Lachnospiraceae bacterium]|nr:DNA translocase FtsK [Lachnospiraceae bacterium]
MSTGTKKSSGSRKTTGAAGRGTTGRSTSTRKSTGRTAKHSTRNTGRSTKNARQSAALKRQELKQEACFIVVCVFMIFLFLCNFGIAGPVGNFFKGVLFGIFGLTAYVAPLLACAAAFYWWARRGQGGICRKVIPAFILFIAAGGFCELFAKRLDTMTEYSIVTLYTNSAADTNGGGVLGGSLAWVLYHYLSVAGAVLILLAIVIICTVLLTEKSFVGLLESMGMAAGSTASRGVDSARRRAGQRADEREKRRQQRAQQEDEEEDSNLIQKRNGFFPMVHMMNDKSSKVQKETLYDEELKMPENAWEEGGYEPSGLNQAAESAQPGFDETVQNTQKRDISGIPFRKSTRTPAPTPKAAEPDRQVQLQEVSYAPSSSDAIRELKRKHTYAQQNVLSEEEVIAETMAYSSSASGSGGDFATREFDFPSDEAGAAGEYVQREIPKEILYGEALKADTESDRDAPGLKKADRPRAALPKSGTAAATSADRGTMGGGTDAFGSGRSAAAKAAGLEASAQTSPVQAAALPPRKYQFPSLTFLNPGKAVTGDSTRELRETAARLKSCLETFGVKVTITDISKGPAVTRYEIQPEQGVKVSKIVNLSDDIKLNLAATDIRIEAPIPGKAAIGIEVPNRENSPVMLRELLESPEFKNFKTEKSKLAFAVGKDISGKVVVTDIAKMPHVLIAGATGSGKSVCINTIILSLIYKASPEDVQMIMIDPKVVELNIYNGIPHLMIPVVTDPKKAAAALHWGVAEMMDRYEKFAQLGVRDLNGYNAKAESVNAAGEGEGIKKLPQIVIIVDELADLMMVSPGEVEESICRLAQLARAAGIHLIIATQRPSVDVITGLIKANMPSRIAFSVTSGVDSRTILDMNGAEKLLGKGDMLFYPQGYAKPVRIQGALVTEEEIGKVVDFLKNQQLGNVYAADIEEKMKNLDSGAAADSSGGGQAPADSKDALFADAGRFIIEKDKASIGMLQRAFRIGFNRAARIMDQLCDYGVVGEEEGTKPRKVLMSPEQFEQLLEEI